LIWRPLGFLMNKSEIRQTGFTMIEILMAIVIFAMVVTMLFSTFNGFQVTSEAVMRDVSFNDKIRTLFKRIQLDMEQIVVLQPPVYSKPSFNKDPDPYRLVGDEVTLGQQMVSTLYFPSLSHADFGLDQRRGVARITYYVKPNDSDRFDLYRSDSLLPSSEANQSCYDPLICRDISGFEVLFFDDDGMESRTWDSEDNQFKFTFPNRIKFKITLGEGEQAHVYESIVGLSVGRVPIE
jgi:general secretion pathway protein J